MSNHFKIIVPFYNAEEWIKVCIRSVKLQNYKNFQCILVDDISTDNSAEIAEQEIANDDRFVLVRNTEKAYALKNIYDAIALSEPHEEDIIVTLDGDDWLANKDVLSKLNSVYAQNSCWLTYGSYAEYPEGVRGKFAKKIPQHIIRSSAFRQHEWCSSHLRTFKHHLWGKIKREDLLDAEGNFYRMAWDLAFMFPMLEMCGNKSHFIKDIMYVYNMANPLNDHKIDNSYQRKLEVEIRNKQRYPRETTGTVALNLLNANRFDIAAKTIYGANRHRKIDTPFCRELYLEHLKVWNNFKEKEPPKTKADHFIKSFDKTLNSIERNGFDDSSSIPVINGSAINGAHRIASCIILDKDPKTHEASISEGQYNCNYEYFANKKDFVKTGLRQEYLDEMALEFCRKKDNLYTVTLFPSHNIPHEDLMRKIKQGYNIIYHKKVKLSKTGQHNYVHNLYHRESWIGPKKQKYPGIIEKSKYCFTQGDKITVILIKEENPENLDNLKDSIRRICGAGKHSVHINDTQEETWRIASSVFNSNSIAFLNNRKISETPRFDEYLSQYHKAILDRQDKHDFCVDSSAVLSAYGLRDCRDLDFLHFKDVPSLAQGIECHNHESHYYRVDKNDIIYDPRLHFYVHGIKLASLQTVKEMKIFRAEEKDFFDCELIDEFDMKYNKIFGWFSHHHKKVYRDILSEVEPGDHILEVGCLLGKSTLYLANLVKDKDVTLHCCDLWESETASSIPEYCERFEQLYGKDLYPEFERNLSGFDFIESHKIDSTEYFKTLKEDFKFKRIYLDGCHKYNTVKSDIISSIKHIENNGVICGDDYGEEVAIAVDEIFGNTVEFTTPRQWFFDVEKNKDKFNKLLNKYHSVRAQDN